MHPGIALDQLGELILKQHAEKRDVIAPTARLTFAAPIETTTAPAGTAGDVLARTASGAAPQTQVVVPRMRLALAEREIDATLTSHALRQLTDWAGIPWKYVERLRTPRERELLEENLAHWLRELNHKRMVRMFESPDGSAIVRAFLSDKYLPLDNYDLAAHIMPQVRASGWDVKSCSLTETRLYLQIVAPSLTRTLQPGEHRFLSGAEADVVHPGVVISNSEVGAGALRIEPMIYRVRCTNGLIAGTALRRNHVGRGFGGGDGDDTDVQQYFRDETRQADDHAFWLKVRDTIDAAFDEARFNGIVDKFEAAMDVQLPKNPEMIADVTQRKLDLNDDERRLVMEHLFGAGDSSLFGLTNAVTRAAQDVKSYDRAIELERAGSDVLTWKASDFAEKTKPSAN